MWKFGGDTTLQTWNVVIYVWKLLKKHKKNQGALYNFCWNLAYLCVEIFALIRHIYCENLVTKRNKNISNFCDIFSLLSNFHLKFNLKEFTILCPVLILYTKKERKKFSSGSKRNDPTKCCIRHNNKTENFNPL